MIKVLKLGGSVITDKAVPLSFRTGVIRNIFVLLKEALDNANTRFVLIHGGGSYGHYIADKLLHSTDNISVHLKVSIIQYYMVALNKLLLRVGLDAGLPLTTITTHSICSCNAGRITCNTSILNNLDENLIPVLYGDAILCDGKVEIVSGDTLALQVCRDINANSLGFLIDKDGVLDSNGTVLREVVLPRDIEKLRKIILKEKMIDVTGGLYTKFSILYDNKEWRGEVCILNGLKTSALREFLVNNKCPGTRVILE